jgi:hypothetical protein
MLLLLPCMHVTEKMSAVIAFPTADSSGSVSVINELHSWSLQMYLIVIRLTTDFQMLGTL